MLGLSKTLATSGHWEHRKQRGNKTGRPQAERLSPGCSKKIPLKQLRWGSGLCDSCYNKSSRLVCFFPAACSSVHGSRRRVQAGPHELMLHWRMPAAEPCNEHVHIQGMACCMCSTEISCLIQSSGRAFEGGRTSQSRCSFLMPVRCSMQLGLA